MECPIKITLTLGSTVGDGVLLATSRSMTLFCSLETQPLSSQQNNIPFFKAGDTLSQIASSIELGILDLQDVQMRQRMGQQSAQMRWKASKGVVSALEAVDEYEQ
jgi:hypothetical protein